MNNIFNIFDIVFNIFEFVIESEHFEFQLVNKIFYNAYKKQLDKKRYINFKEHIFFAKSSKKIGHVKKQLRLNIFSNLMLIFLIIKEFLLRGLDIFIVFLIFYIKIYLLKLLII